MCGFVNVWVYSPDIGIHYHIDRVFCLYISLALVSTYKDEILKNRTSEQFDQ